MKHRFLFIAFTCILLNHDTMIHADDTTFHQEKEDVKEYIAQKVEERLSHLFFNNDAQKTFFAQRFYKDVYDISEEIYKNVKKESAFKYAPVTYVHNLNLDTYIVSATKKLLVKRIKNHGKDILIDIAETTYKHTDTGKLLKDRVIREKIINKALEKALYTIDMSCIVYPSLMANERGTLYQFFTNNYKSFITAAIKECFPTPSAPPLEETIREMYPNFATEASRTHFNTVKLHTKNALYREATCSSCLENFGGKCARVILVCGHAALCAQCFRDMVYVHNNTRCPLCRHPIDKNDFPYNKVNDYCK